MRTMGHAFAFANRSLHTHFGKKKGGATLAAVRINGQRRQLVIGHVGDARVALVRHGRVVRATRDHTASDPLEAEGVRLRGGTVFDEQGCAR